MFAAIVRPPAPVTFPAAEPRFRHVGVARGVALAVAVHVIADVVLRHY